MVIQDRINRARPLSRSAAIRHRVFRWTGASARPESDGSPPVQSLIRFRSLSGCFGVGDFPLTSVRICCNCIRMAAILEQMLVQSAIGSPISAD